MVRGTRAALEWETEVGVRVGVRNRLGEAIGEPVANLHGRVGQHRGRAPRKGQKGRAPVSSKATGLFSAREGPTRISRSGSRLPAKSIGLDCAPIRIFSSDLSRLTQQNRILVSIVIHSITNRGKSEIPEDVAAVKSIVILEIMTARSFRYIYYSINNP